MLSFCAISRYLLSVVGSKFTEPLLPLLYLSTYIYLIFSFVQAFKIWVMIAVPRVLISQSIVLMRNYVTLHRHNLPTPSMHATYSVADPGDC